MESRIESMIKNMMNIRFLSRPVLSRTLLAATASVGGLICAGTTCFAGGNLDDSTAAGMGGLENNPVVAQYLVRNTLLDIGLRDSPTQADYQLASALIALASDMDSGNVEYARLLVASAWSAGDWDTMIQATRRVIKNDPNDTVAQLRLVSSMINAKQTIEGRLALYERFLGDAGKSLDVSVRSRLALDAALLEREQGNASGFLERLHQSTRLDPSHKAAASLAAQYYSSARENPVGNLEYQIKLLMSDPLDPNVHLAMTRLLAKEGAFVPAQRFLNNAVALFSLESGRTPPIIEEIRFSLKWQVDGPSGVTEELNPVLRDRRASAQSLIDSYIEAELPTDELMQPDDIRYDIEIDRLRLLASYIDNDEEGTQAVLNDIQATVNNEINAIGILMNRRGANQGQLLSQVITRTMDFQVMRAIVGIDAEEIRKDMAVLTDGVAAMEERFAVIEPMALYAEGKYEEAIQEAEKFPVSPTLELISALGYEKIGNPELATEIYVRLSRGHALTGLGAFARSRLIAMGKNNLTITTAGRQMIQIANTVPTWIDMMNTRVSTFMYLGIVEPARQIDPLMQPKMKIRLRNVAPVPLALGPSQPMNSRFLIVTKIDELSAGFMGQVKSKVVEFDHRLRLEPYEEVVVEVDADSAQTQWLLAMQPNVSIRQRWRLLQGFQPRVPDSTLASIKSNTYESIYGITNSPLGLTAETGISQRLILIETTYPVEQLISELQTDDLVKQRRVINACAARLLLPASGDQLDAQQQQELVNALIEVYTHASKSLQAQMILQLPHRHQVASMMDFDDHVMSSLVSDALIDSTVDPMIFACVLLTRTDAADSPIFEVLDQVSDQRLLEAAGIIKARIESGIPTLGTIGPGVESMIPMKDYFGQ